MVGRQTPSLALLVPFALVFMADGRRGVRADAARGPGATRAPAPSVYRIDESRPNFSRRR